MKICKNCKKNFITNHNNQRYCSDTCKENYNWIKLPCLECGKVRKKERKYARPGKDNFCNNDCQQLYNYHQYIIRWKAGEETGNKLSGKFIALSGHVRRYLLEECDDTCEECGENRKHPSGDSIMECHHIDGDASNTTPDNMEVLCPTCHALTENYRARNKNSKRKVK